MKPSELKVGMEIELYDDRRTILGIGKEKYFYKYRNECFSHDVGESMDWIDTLQNWQPVKKTKKRTVYRPIIKIGMTCDESYLLGDVWKTNKDDFKGYVGVVGWETKEIEVEE